MEKMYVGAVVVELQPGERAHIDAVHAVMYYSGGSVLYNRRTV